ncbi:hypothetical protein ACFSX5_09775 [Devosia albogilva]|uniref:NnrS family protein n=1 Tax=Devosia albogilva TaxID=429726 RepID=A0ABW5QKE7_9HYPH
MPPKLVPRTLLAATAVTAVAGLYGGLLRFGAALPFLATPVDLHGLVMMHGVFGTLVPLERAVALGRPWWFAAPLLSVTGIAMLLAGLPAGLGLLLLSAAIFALMSIRVMQLQPTAFNFSLLLGATALLLGTTVLAHTGDPTEAMPLWLVFLVLTVAGERLELSRLTGTGRRATVLFVLIAGAMLAGATPAVRQFDAGMILPAAMMAMAAWLSLNDVARHRLRAGGQTAFMAVAILCGHFWLAVAGLAALGEPQFPAMRDLFIHAVGLGFAMSMIMGHALIILPAVAGLRVAYRPAMYLPLALLQISVAARGLGLLNPNLFMMSGVATMTALVLFGAMAWFGR